MCASALALLGLVGAFHGLLAGPARRHVAGRHTPSGTASIRAAPASTLFCTRLSTASQQRADSPQTARPFSAICALAARTCRQAAEHGRAPLLYSPPRRGRTAPPSPRNATRRGVGRRPLCTQRSSTPGPRSKPSCGARSPTPPTTSGSRRCARAAIEGDELLVGAPEEIRTWVADRFARVLQTCAASVLGEATTVTIVPLEAPSPAHAGAAAGAARRYAAGPPPHPAAERRLQPEVHVRPVRDRRREPPRARGRARRRRAARPGLQPAVPLRAARARQDAPAARDRQLRHTTTATG